MAVYLSTQQYETLDLDSSSVEERDSWDVDHPFDGNGLIAVRPVGSPTRVIAILSPDDFATQFSLVPEDSGA